jgi:hypothetical protein
MLTATFDEWVEAAFAHPVRAHEWYWDDDFEERWDALGLSDSVVVKYMTRCS